MLLLGLGSYVHVASDPTLLPNLLQPIQQCLILHRLCTARYCGQLHTLWKTLALVRAEWLVGESGRSVRKPLCHELVRLLDTVVAGCLPICLVVGVCLSYCLPACLPAVCLSVCLSVCLPACLRAYLPACLFVYLPVYLSFSVSLLGCLWYLQQPELEGLPRLQMKNV